MLSALTLGFSPPGTFQATQGCVAYLSLIQAPCNSDVLKKSLCVFVYPRFMEIIKKFDCNSIVAVYLQNKPFL